MEKYAVVMAGGTGSRLWPLSRESKPKQFIIAENGKCMLMQTIERLSPIVPPEKCFIITNKNLLNITKKTVKGVVPFSNIIAEPSRKNTAACIAYASMLIKEKYGQGVICFVPADGYVKNKDDYRAAVKLAFKAAEDTNDLVIIGIKPTYPATGYGYIQIEGKTAGDSFPVRRFIEKPDIDTAKKLTRSQDFLWNSGILLGNAETIAENVKQFLPDHFEKLAQAIKYIGKQDFSQRLDDAYSNIESISFDYGVLEKSSRIQAVRGVFDWDDIGSLDALAKTFRSDGKGNLVKGDHFGIGTSNCVIYSEDTPITTMGVDNMIIAVLKDTALICPRNRSQDIKSLVDLLRSNGCSYLT